MQVQEVLDKITDKNAAIVGCIAKSGDKIYHNLGDYGIDQTVVAETVSDMLDLTATLGDHCVELNTVFTEYDGHCVLGQRVGDDLLVAVTEHLQSAGYKKLQVNLSLQTRMLTRALEAAANAPQVVEAAPAPAPTPEPAAQATPAEDPAKKGKRRRVYRGVVFWD